MREIIQPGAIVDGYLVGECIHEGGTGAIFRAVAPRHKEPGFPIVLKAPFLGRGEPSVGIDSFEMEQTILPTLEGPHVPRFVAAGDVTTTPYLVMEWVEGAAAAGRGRPHRGGAGRRRPQRAPAGSRPPRHQA